MGASGVDRVVMGMGAAERGGDGCGWEGWVGVGMCVGGCSWVGMDRVNSHNCNLRFYLSCLLNTIIALHVLCVISCTVYILLDFVSIMFSRTLCL